MVDTLGGGKCGQIRSISHIYMRLDPAALDIRRGSLCDTQPTSELESHPPFFLKFTFSLISLTLVLFMLLLLLLLLHQSASSSIQSTVLSWRRLSSLSLDLYGWTAFLIPLLAAIVKLFLPPSPKRAHTIYLHHSLSLPLSLSLAYRDSINLGCLAGWKRAGASERAAATVQPASRHRRTRKKKTARSLLSNKA
jgi:hypothetical protein